MRAMVIISISVLIVSCSTLERSTLLGGVIGGTIGGLLGNSSAGNSKRDQSTIIGSTVGIGLGSLIGYSAFKEKQRKESINSWEQKPFDSKEPSLTAPKVRRIWVPARIEGERYIDGHYMYVIEKTSSWSE